LIQGSDGNFYGTTAEGGANSAGGTKPGGTLFKLTPAGVETVLYSFGSSSTDGTAPNGVIQGTDGNFYGTTSHGGANQFGTGGGVNNEAGTAFKITPAGVETVLYSFGSSSTDGVIPTGLIQGTDGNFYGTTSGGGANSAGDTKSAGTVFELTPAGVETVLYSFGSNSSDGTEPNGFLIQGSDGNFYGTTLFSGGVHNDGTVWSLSK
jgi:uncharacterized repeat protein (TIGR03803 family)